MRKLLILCGVVLVAMAGGVWSTWESAPAFLRGDGADPAQIAMGAEVYEAACATCHGVDLEGQPDWRVRRSDGRLPAPPHDETGHTWHHSDEVLFNITKYGMQYYAGDDYRSEMPAFEGLLSDEEVVAVIEFIKSTWPAHIRELQERRNEP
jgi:S-disulfanyl-L-cysteine oxidoreductase SoxD